MSIRLRHPVPGARMTDRYGWRGAIPGVVAAQLHNGQDWAANAGTRILAAHAGWVAFNGWDTQGGGWLVEIRDDSGFATRYAHMNRQSNLAYGQRVAAGQKVGEVGSTGWATGPHLHFILRLANGNTTDPVPHIVNPNSPAPKPKPVSPTPTPAPSGKGHTQMFMIALKNGRKKGEHLFAITGPGYWNEFAGQAAATNINRQLTGGTTSPALFVSRSFWNHCKRAARV